MNSLTKESYKVCLEDFKNRVDHLLNVTSNISEKFDNKYLMLILSNYMKIWIDSNTDLDRFVDDNTYYDKFTEFIYSENSL